MKLNALIKNKAEEILMTSYDGDDEITNAEDIIENLIIYIEDLEKQINDIEQDIEDNYMRIPVADQI